MRIKKRIIPRDLIYSAALCAFLIVGGVSTPAHAADDISRNDLMGLAQEFLTRIGNGFEQADNNAKDILTPTYSTPDRIPDGEELILQTFAGKDRVPLNYDVLAIKQSYGVDFLLEDFFAAVGFPIFFDYDDLTAEGWFIREDQTFSMDLNNQAVSINGTVIPLAENDVFEIDGEYYVQSTALSRWFNLQFQYDLEELRTTIVSRQPLPAEDRLKRKNRNQLKISRRSDPILPFEEQEYSAFGVPNLDVNLRSSYFKSGDNDATKRNSYSIIGAGDLAYFSANTFATGNDDEPLSTLRMSFEREDPDGGMLGSLKAEYFGFGDINTTRLPLTSRSSQEQGIRLSNNTVNKRNGLSTTFFRGDAQPNWDAELYRGESLIATQEIGDDGQYEFLDVPLFIGENNFKIILYGPQGEIREINETVPVTNDDVAGNKVLYDVSLSRANEITYRVNDLDNPEDGTPVLTARFDRPITDRISGYAGLQSRDEGDTRRTYLETGANAYLLNTFFDLNTAVELSEQEAGIELVSRRKFGAHDLRSATYFATDGFQPGPQDEQDPNVIRTSLQLNGPAKNFFGLRSNYSIDTNFFRTADGDNQYNANASYSTRLKNTVVNQTLSFVNRDDDTTGNDQTLNYGLNTRGFFNGGFYRLSSNYAIIPDLELQALAASYNYPITPNLETRAEVEHRLNPSQTEFTGSLNWKTKKATISPRFSYNTEDILQASLNVRFGVGYNPVTNDFNMYNQRLTNTGGVAARIYLDTNGNGVYDDGEELIQGAELNAIQARRESLSDEKGIAFIPDLPRGVITDINVDQASLYDPYYIPNYEGVSIRPRPGVVKELDFPIVVGGEMDGTVYMMSNNDEQIPARQYTLNLVAPWGEVIQSTQTAYDGFYVFSQIPPGVYYLTGDFETALRTDTQLAAPQIYTFKPDGSIYYEQDLLLNEGRAFPYTFSSDIPPTSRKNKQVLKNIGPISAQARIGPYKSKLGLGIALLKLKRIKNNLPAGLSIQDEFKSVTRSADDQMFWIDTIASDNSLETSEDTCSTLIKFDIGCEVHIFTSAYNEETVSLLTEGDDDENG